MPTSAGRSRRPPALTPSGSTTDERGSGILKVAAARPSEDRIRGYACRFAGRWTCRSIATSPAGRAAWLQDSEGTFTGSSSSPERARATRHRLGASGPGHRVTPMSNGSTSLGALAGLDTATKALLGLRLGFAASTWVAPRKTGRLFGIDADENHVAPYLGRLFGSRDAWMAAEVVLAADNGARRQLLTRHTAVDAADLVATIFGWLAGYLTGRAAAATALVAVGALGLAAATIAGKKG